MGFFLGFRYKTAGGSASSTQKNKQTNKPTTTTTNNNKKTYKIKTPQRNILTCLVQKKGTVEYACHYEILIFFNEKQNI